VYLVGDMMTRFAADELDKIGFDMDTVQTSLSALDIGDALRALLKDSDEKYIVVFKGSQNTVFLEESIKQILADPADVGLLPRQNNWWMERKNKFFESLRK